MEALRFPETECTKLRLFENMLSIRVLEANTIPYFQKITFPWYSQTKYKTHLYPTWDVCKCNL